jgi:hypothetical protein
MERGGAGWSERPTVCSFFLLSSSPSNTTHSYLQPARPLQTPCPPPTGPGLRPAAGAAGRAARNCRRPVLFWFVQSNGVSVFFSAGEHRVGGARRGGQATSVCGRGSALCSGPAARRAQPMRRVTPGFYCFFRGVRRRPDRRRPPLSPSIARLPHAPHPWAPWRCGWEERRARVCGWPRTSGDGARSRGGGAPTDTRPRGRGRVLSQSAKKRTVPGSGSPSHAFSHIRRGQTLQQKGRVRPSPSLPRFTAPRSCVTHAHLPPRHIARAVTHSALLLKEQKPICPPRPPPPSAPRPRPSRRRPPAALPARRGCRSSPWPSHPGRRRCGGMAAALSAAPPAQARSHRLA